MIRPWFDVGVGVANWNTPIHTRTLIKGRFGIEIHVDVESLKSVIFSVW